MSAAFSFIPFLFIQNALDVRITGFSDSHNYWTFKLSSSTFSEASQLNLVIMEPHRFCLPSSIQTPAKKISSGGRKWQKQPPPSHRSDLFGNMQSHCICTCDWCCFNICISNISLSHTHAANSVWSSPSPGRLTTSTKEGVISLVTNSSLNELACQRTRHFSKYFHKKNNYVLTWCQSEKNWRSH